MFEVSVISAYLPLWCVSFGMLEISAFFIICYVLELEFSRHLLQELDNFFDVWKDAKLIDSG